MDRAQRLVLLVCLGAGWTTLLDQSILNVNLPALRASLGAGDATLQWIMAGYSLTFGLALVPAGRLGDMFGRRGLFAGGLALFGAAGVVAACADRAWLVAAARLVQGIGAGTVNPQIIGLFQDLFQGRERARALAAYAVIGGLSASVGPPLGGLILQLAGAEPGWRYVLLLNLPFVLVTAPLGLRLLPAGRPPKGHRTDLDVPGLLLLGAATVALILPLVGTPGGWRWAVLAALAAAGLVVCERRYTASGRTALLLPALTRSRGYVLGTLVAMSYFGATLALNLVLSLYLQDDLGFPPLAAAAMSLPSAVGFAAASAASASVLARFGRPGVSVAIAVAAAGIALDATAVALLPGAALVAVLAVGQLVTGVAGGLVNAPNQALTLQHAPPGANGLSAAILQLAQRLAASLGIAAATALSLGGAGRPALVRGVLLCLTLVVAALVASAALARGERDRDAHADPDHGLDQPGEDQLADRPPVGHLTDQ
ncbi:MFS transporter [Dactylosporangium darangshiense]|uniref:MFS transporter n=1 Tax=Dactylosporangium darangshiense TaxID=579108 RepID=A0ABP8DF54_9ACTN